MAKKSLLGAAEKAIDPTKKRFLDEQRNTTKRLTFDVSGADHLEFKKAAADAGLSMTDFFYRIWKNDR